MSANEPRWDKNAREIQAEAARWIEIREAELCETEGWSPARQAELDTWLAESSAHLVAFLRAEAVWQRADRLRALSPPGPMRVSTPGNTSSRSTTLRVAAAVIVLCLAGAGSFALLQVPREKTYSTAIGARQTLTLSDGSTIELNTNTSVRVAYEKGRRNIWLDRGEAFFDVKHDTARPFIVTMGDRRVIDLGTKFNIRREAARIEVALLEGKARFDSVRNAKASQQTILTPGDIITATDKTVSLKRKANEEMAGQLGWRTGMLVFEQATLAEVAREYNRYNRTQLIIADPATARLTISGTLPANDPGAFTRLATKFFNLTVKTREGELVVTR